MNKEKANLLKEIDKMSKIFPYIIIFDIIAFIIVLYLSIN